MHYLSICAIHKCETPHLQEWIDYHRLIGVEHFYLADNNDEPCFAAEILAPYIRARVVTSIHMPGKHLQLSAYNHLLALADSVWAAFIDLDEFLFPIETYRLTDILSDYEEFGGLVANWCCFGSSGLKNRPQSVLRQLNRRAPDEFKPNRHVKSVVQLSKVLSYNHPHFPVYKAGFFNVNEDFERVDGPFQSLRQRRLRLNHYVLRSRENFLERQYRGRGTGPGNPFTEDYWTQFDCNTVHDDRIWAKYGAEFMKSANATPISGTTALQTTKPMPHLSDSYPTVVRGSFRPVYWMRVPAAVMHLLRHKGFHDGYWKSAGGTDVLLDRVFCGDLSRKGKSGQIEGLRLWSTFIERECCASHGYPTLWHPNVNPSVAFEALGADRIITIEAGNEADALFEFYLSKWRLGIFYHVACMGNWRDVTAEQLDLCKRVGLDGFHVTCLGDREQRLELEAAFQIRGIDYVIEYWSPDLQMYEVPAITLLQDWCRNHRSAYALYFHTKGVSNPRDTHKRMWRLIMEREVIARWKENASILRNDADIVGVNWRDSAPTSHMPGNFYMARSDYISDNLQDFGQYYRKPPFWDSWPSNSYRLQCEFWLGSYRTHPRVHSLVSRNERIDHANYFQRHTV